MVHLQQHEKTDTRLSREHVNPGISSTLRNIEEPHLRVGQLFKERTTGSKPCGSSLPCICFYGNDDHSGSGN